MTWAADQSRVNVFGVIETLKDFPCLNVRQGLCTCHKIDHVTPCSPKSACPYVDHLNLKDFVFSNIVKVDTVKLKQLEPITQ